MVRGSLGRSSLEDEEEEECLSLKPLNEDEEDACPSLPDPRVPLEACIVNIKKSTITSNSNYVFSLLKTHLPDPHGGDEPLLRPREPEYSPFDV